VWETTVGKTAGPSDARPTPYSPYVLERLYEKWFSEGISLL
jgi:hypothetical protein